MPLDRRTLLLMAPAAFFLLAFYALPIGISLFLSVGSRDALADFVEIATDLTTRIVFWQTFDMAFQVTLAALVISYPIAYLLVRLDRGRQAMLLVAILLPYWISTLVRSYAWIVLLGRDGPLRHALRLLSIQTPDLLYNRPAAMIGMINVVVPLMVIILYNAFGRIDQALVRVALSMGGSPGYVFGRVWLPLSMPGVAAGTVIVFLVSLGVFTTPAMLGGATETSVAMAIEAEINKVLDVSAAASLSFLLLVAALAILIVARNAWVPALIGVPGKGLGAATLNAAFLFDWWPRLRARLRAPTPGKASRPCTPATVTGGTWLKIAAGLGVIYILLPIFVVVALSFSGADFLQFPPRSLSLRWFSTFFSSADWTGATQRSFVVAIITTTLSLVLALSTAYATEIGRVRGKQSIYIVILSPLVVPPTILALGLYYIYSKLGWIGSLPALAAAHIVLVFPFVFITLSQGFRSIPPSIINAAQSLGAGRFMTFRSVMLPMLSGSLVSGGLLAFLTSFDELILAMFLTNSRSATLPKRMWDSVRFEIDPTNAAAAAILIGISVLILFLSRLCQIHARRGLAATVSEP